MFIHSLSPPNVHMGHYLMLDDILCLWPLVYSYYTIEVTYKFWRDSTTSASAHKQKWLKCFPAISNMLCTGSTCQYSFSIHLNLTSQTENNEELNNKNASVKVAFNALKKREGPSKVPGGCWGRGGRNVFSLFPWGPSQLAEPGCSVQEMTPL